MATEFQANKIGTILFDSNQNVIYYSGIGETRLRDIQELSAIKLDSDGYGMVSDAKNKLLVYLYRKDDITLATYVNAPRERSADQLPVA